VKREPSGRFGIEPAEIDPSARRLGAVRAGRPADEEEEEEEAAAAADPAALAGSDVMT
jgi:hypothetical protein